MDFVKKHVVTEKINEILAMDKLDRIMEYINSKLKDPTFLFEHMNAPNPVNTFLFDFTGSYNFKDIEYLERKLETAGWTANVQYTSHSIHIVMNRN